jgi:acyl-lipid omega-6 desaturase (Delta-12 desaturase)
MMGARFARLAQRLYPVTMHANRELLVADADGWRRRLSPYQRPDDWRSSFELAITVLPLGLAWFVMLIALQFHLYWLYGLLLFPAAGFLVRLFMIQHDCGHGAFFGSATANQWVGRLAGVLTLTPYDHWRRSHAIHHATSGNLDRRGTGDINTLTSGEYCALSSWGRLSYRLYRHPAVMFGLGPAYVFFLENRLPFGSMRKGWMPWVSTTSTNVGIAAWVALTIWAFGLQALLLTYVATALIAAATGVWLFFVQHQFDPANWVRDERWNASEAALGSSYYALPAPLSWFTANIGVHHVHHLSSRIPYYRLPEVLRDYPSLRGLNRVNLVQSLGCPRLALWDEARQRLVSFRDVEALRLDGHASSSRA